MTFSPDDQRFEFGANWSRFLETVNEDRIAAAVQSLQRWLGESLAGKSFLDVGSGSGLFSLAAHRLGARVRSFDYDPQSVACTSEMRRRFAPDSADWQIQRGSALDADYLRSLSEFDVVYSWGVLHHTGEMWRAIDAVSHSVSPGGRLWLAIYNDQGSASDCWKLVKQLYQRLPGPLRTVLVVLVGGYLTARKLLGAAGSFLVRLLTGNNPFAPLRSFAADVRKADPRGMHRWYDLVDWVGGWPFEVARPEEVLRFLRDRGFELTEIKTCDGRLGCNEFLLRRTR